MLLKHHTSLLSLFKKGKEYFLYTYYTIGCVIINPQSWLKQLFKSYKTIACVCIILLFYIYNLLSNPMEHSPECTHNLTNVCYLLNSSHLATCWSKYENITQHSMVDTGFGKSWKPFRKLEFWFLSPQTVRWSASAQAFPLSKNDSIGVSLQHLRLIP